MRRVRERDGETPQKVVESSNKCFICSSIPTSKNKVYIFGKTSTDLAGIIRSSLEFDVKKYHEGSSFFVCRQCFQQLTKYKRAAEELREIKQELLTAFRNREQLREKRLAPDENSKDPEMINNGDMRVNAAKSLRFSTETSHVYSNPAACTSYTTRPPVAQLTPVPSSRQAFLFTGISPIQTKNDAQSQGDVHGNLRGNVAKDFHLSKPGCCDSTIVKLQVHSFLSPEDAIHSASTMDRDLWVAPIFSPRFTEIFLRSFMLLSKWSSRQ